MNRAITNDGNEYHDLVSRNDHFVLDEVLIKVLHCLRWRLCSKVFQILFQPVPSS